VFRVCTLVARRRAWCSYGSITRSSRAAKFESKAPGVNPARSQICSTLAPWNPFWRTPPWPQSGVALWWPRAGGSPTPLSALHHVLPVGYAVDGIRRLMHGGPVDPVAGDVAVLTAYVLLALGVSRSPPGGAGSGPLYASGRSSRSEVTGGTPMCANRCLPGLAGSADLEDPVVLTVPHGSDRGTSADRRRHPRGEAADVFVVSPSTDTYRRSKDRRGSGGRDPPKPQISHRSSGLPLAISPACGPSNQCCGPLATSLPLLVAQPRRLSDRMSRTNPTRQSHPYLPAATAAGIPGAFR
jgi:hypothetical protein